MTNHRPRPLTATQVLKQVMGEYYRGLQRAAASNEGRVAWCSSIGPSELLTAMGFEVFFPENHAARLGVGRLATDLIPRAVAAGYAPAVCSYLTSDVGAYLAGVTALPDLNAKTCPYNTNSRFGLPRRLQAETGRPTLVLDGDLNDLRCFSEEQTRTNVEAYIELLAEGQSTEPRGQANRRRLFN